MSNFLSGVGVDIEDISRFENISADFCDLVFTENEKKYCFSSAQSAKHFAVRFCAKEAIFKALSTFEIKDCSFQDVEIMRRDDGMPYVKFDKFSDIIFSLSLSHCKDKAVAYVLAQKEV